MADVRIPTGQGTLPAYLAFFDRHLCSAGEPA
jgi:hypothetical protein